MLFRGFTMKLSKFCPLVNITRRICSQNSPNIAPELEPNWKIAVREAEKVAGYPTSFLNLRCLLNDDIGNVAAFLKRLIGTNHPLLEMCRDFFFKIDHPSWTLVVLLISKVAGVVGIKADIEYDKRAGVLHSQRVLAEVSEMIRTSQVVHKCVVNLQKFTEQSDDTLFGNKISLLCGDYLLSRSCAELAGLRNQEVVELMSSAVRDLAEAEFVGVRDKQNNPLPAKPNAESAEDLSDNNGITPIMVGEALGDANSEWTLRHVLNSAGLLGKSCQSTLKLAGHPLKLQEQGYSFGKHLALAWQAYLDRQPFVRGSTGPFSLVCAPVMFHLHHYEPSLYAEIEKGKDSVDDIDFESIRKRVLLGPGLECTKLLQRRHCNMALDVLNKLPQSDARAALENIIGTIQN